MEIKFKIVFERADESTYLSEIYTLGEFSETDVLMKENKTDNWVDELAYVCTFPKESKGDIFDVYLGDIIEVHSGDSMRSHYAVVQKCEDGSFGYNTPWKNQASFQKGFHWFHPGSMDIYQSEDDFITVYTGYIHTGFNSYTMAHAEVKNFIDKRIDKIEIECGDIS